MQRLKRTCKVKILEDVLDIVNFLMGKAFLFIYAVSNTCPINNREKRRGRKRRKGRRGVREGGRDVHDVTVAPLTPSL